MSSQNRLARALVLSGLCLCVSLVLAQAPTAPKKLVAFDWHSRDKKLTAVDAKIESLGRFEATEVKSDPEGIARKVLSAVGASIMGVRVEAAGAGDINKHLAFERSLEDQTGGTTVVFKQSFEGVPVYGADVRVHIDRAGKPHAITSKFFPHVIVSSIAAISPRQALDKAKGDSTQPAELRDLPQIPPKLMVYLHSDSAYHLVWVVEIPGVEVTQETKRPARWKYFIDAENGKVLSRYNDLKFQSSASGRGLGVNGSERVPLYTLQVAPDLFVLQDVSLPGPKIKTFDFKYQDIYLNASGLPGDPLQQVTNAWSDPAVRPAVDAHFFARAVFDYYWTVHGRNSLDNRGMDLISSIRGTFFQQPGPGGDLHKWNNAVWTGTQMVYGDGDNVRFGPLSGALDVVAHEFTHGVTEKTADLEYRNQSGALNESYSDVFAAMVDNANWTLGEDVMLPRNAGKALRSLEDPRRFGQPDHMRDYVVTSQDNGGVHWNSGIPNKVAYLLSAGGVHNGITVHPLGREITAQIYYLTLTKYLSALSDFEDARRQTLKAADDLFPGDSAKGASIANAFAAVGIGSPTTESTTGQQIVVVAYGDTRTGFWGLGDNYKQATHAKVVSEILASAEPIDAVIFTGDAVMTNFPLWRKQYWRFFLAQTDRFVHPFEPVSGRPRVPFYPSLGNHETYRNMPLVLETLQDVPPRAESAKGARWSESISQAYDRGEESVSKARPLTEGTIAGIDLATPAGLQEVSKWIDKLDTGSSGERSEAAHKLGQFEGKLQEAFYEQSAEGRCSDDAEVFANAYLDLADYRYLEPSTSDERGVRRSFYSVVLERSPLKVKLIALDTNCLDYGPQQGFFRHEVEGFDGSIVVFGHHPPIDESNTSVPAWDRIRGWEFYKPYLTTPAGKQIRLWVLGHVHNYQRRNARPASDGKVLGPVLLIAGGGGASDLNSTPGPNQWQPEDWPKQFPIVKAYNFVRISITSAAISVDAFGASESTKPFSKIDSFSVSLR